MMGIFFPYYVRSLVQNFLKILMAVLEMFGAYRLRSSTGFFIGI